MEKLRLIVCLMMSVITLNACGLKSETTSNMNEEDIVVITDDSWRNNMEMTETMESSLTTHNQEERDETSTKKEENNTTETRKSSMEETSKVECSSRATTQVRIEQYVTSTVTMESNTNIASVSTSKETEMTAPDIFQILGSNVTESLNEQNENPQAPNYWEVNWENQTVTTTTVQEVRENIPSIQLEIPTQDLENQLFGNITATVNVQEMPQNVKNAINVTKSNYPNAQIAVGLFDLETLNGYAYNPNQQISAGCTIKAAYAMYVLKTCEEQNIDISNERIVIKNSDYHGGSGVILPKLENGKNRNREANLQASVYDTYLKYGDALTVEDLLTVLLGESDNMAYEMLYDRFSMSDFREFLAEINGQKLQKSSGINRDGYQMFGAPTVYDRLNEWYAIYQYINSERPYSSTLKSMLTGTKYCYAVGWMNSNHNYMHKSGWIEGRNSCAADCALLDGRYLLIVLMSDSREDISNANEIRRIGSAAEVYFSPEYY